MISQEAPRKSSPKESVVGNLRFVQDIAFCFQGAFMKNENSTDFFYLIDHAGHRYVPRKVQERKNRRRYGYAIHPVGEGNNIDAAEVTEDEQRLVQQVVLNGKLVRTTVFGGEQDGQSNTVGFTGSRIRGYWLCPTKMGWVAGARLRPENEGVSA